MLLLFHLDVFPYLALIDASIIRDDCQYYVNIVSDGINSTSKQYFRTKYYILKDGAKIWLYSLFKYFYLHF